VTVLSTVHEMMTNNEAAAAKRAEDSTGMVGVVVYNPLIPAGNPMATQMFLPCRMGRTTIMSVRRMLSEIEIDMYAGVGQWLSSIPWSDRLPGRPMLYH